MLRLVRWAEVVPGATVAREASRQLLFQQHSRDKYEHTMGICGMETVHGVLHSIFISVVNIAYYMI